MSKMKYSKVEWIGDIPEKWQISKIKFVAEVYTGNSISDDDKSMYEDKEDAYPYIATKDINVEDSTTDYANGMYTKINDKKFKLAHFKDTLLCIEGGSAGRKISQIDRTVSFVNKLCCISSKKVDKDYMYYYLKSDSFIKKFNQNITGLIGGVSQFVLKQFNICIPSLKEQKLIANFLAEKVNKIDNILADLNKQVEILNNYKKSLITEVIIKGLNKNVEFKDSGIEWIRQIPKHWKIKKIGYFAHVTKLAGFEFTDYFEYVPDGDVIAVRVLNLKNFNLNFDNVQKIYSNVSDKLPRSRINENDILMSYAGTVGTVGFIEKLEQKLHLAPNVSKITVLDECIPKYLAYYLISYVGQEEIYNLKNKTAQESISMENIRKIKVIIPEKNEQQDIVKYLDKKCYQIDKIIEEKQKQVEKIENYKKSVIYEYVTGKKRVEGAEKTYE